MKKILIIVAFIFAVNLGCKKLQLGGEGLCACSPVAYPSLSLVIKNTAEQDLLNPATPGSVKQDQIKLFQKLEDGSSKQIQFYVRPPFSIAEENFIFSQILSEEIIRLSTTAGKKFYLQISDKPAIEMSLILEPNSGKVEKVLLDGKESTKASGNFSKNLNIYYVVL